MGNLNIINQAIDEYNLLTKSQKKILKSLVQLSVNNEVIITIEELSKINKITRATVSAALELFSKKNIITIPDTTGIRFSSCVINQIKIDEIVQHYNNKSKFL
jgi:Fe2+ or Zn2+ uptake regulation protein